MVKKSKIAVGIAGLGVVIAAGLGGVGSAGAGHGGALTTGTFDGRAEVAAGATNGSIVGDPNGRGEAYVFSTGAGVICYVIEVSKIAPATAAHIHEAAAGANGPPVLTLSAPRNGSSAGCIDTGNPTLAAEIALSESSNYYVNVHNAEFPGGAVRAQLGS